MANRNGNGQYEPTQAMLVEAFAVLLRTSGARAVVQAFGLAAERVAAELATNGHTAEAQAERESLIITTAGIAGIIKELR